MKYTPRTKPFKHQSQATLRAVRQRNHAIFFEPRLGKTKAALDWVGILALKGELSRVVVLAPRVALDVWEDQIRIHFPYNAHVETFDEEWEHEVPATSDESRPSAPVKFFLAGREETMRATRVKRKLHRPKQKILEDWRPDAIIVDESHEYKRPGGRGAQDAWRLVARLRKLSNNGHPYVLLLSGTPTPKGYRDLFAQFRIMDPSLLGTSVADFDERYVTFGQGARKYTILQYRNLSRLKLIIRENSTVCTAAKAGLEGELFFQRLTCELPQRVRERYNEMADEFVTEIKGQLLTSKNQGVKRLRLLQITSGFLTDGTKIHSNKVETAKDWLHLLYGEGESVVVYCRFTAEVDAYGSLTAAVGFDSAVIDGRTPHVERAAALRHFQSKAGSRPRALVFQYQSGSQAIELTTAAEVLFTTLPDGWTTYWQCLNRVRGPKQTRPVRITAITAKGTVDTSVLSALQGKSDLHQAMMRGPRRFMFGLRDRDTMNEQQLPRRQR